MLRKLFGIKSNNESKKQNTPKKESNFDTQVDRNLKGKELESQGKIDEAKELYLQNVNEGFEGNHPYDRLAIMFRKEKAYDKEIEVLEKAINVFEKKVNKQRADRQPKLDRFKKRLEDVKEKV
ncbi:tetratricopeptide repeat protein [Caldalkalibacillus salinus]|uniref:tetratricopeptide repeat protein n=1 Tax=Caldalkalibacillus salinus TaxID=2803787 RepID=UPI00192190DA|nr:tetratricopeptide repeat protein [Caldalkalibacillus salinus]